MARHRHRGIRYFTSTFAIVLGVVLIWRGVWYVLDGIDKMFFGGNHYFSVAGGMLLGVLILYLPDRDLSELRKL